MSIVLGIVMLAGSAMAAEIPAGPGVPTVAGNIARVNRPAYDADRDMFFRHHKRTFANAFVFDRAMLERLGVKTIHVKWAGRPLGIGDRGPLWPVTEKDVGLGPWACSSSSADRRTATG